MKKYKKILILISLTIIIIQISLIVFCDGSELLFHKENSNGDTVVFKIGSTRYAKLNDDAGYMYVDEKDTTDYYRIKKRNIFAPKQFIRAYKFANDSDDIFLQTDEEQNLFLNGFTLNIYYNANITLPKLTLDDIQSIYISSIDDEKEIYDKELISKMINLVKTDDLYAESIPFKELTSGMKLQKNFDEQIWIFFKFKKWDNLLFFISKWIYDVGEYYTLDHVNNFAFYYGDKN